jgi:hypothetical protein
MRDKKLPWLIALLTLFVTGHNVDHFIRDGFSVPLVVVVGVIYALIALSVVLYVKGKAGMRYFTIASVLGFAFGWLGHFSPYTDQPPTYILAAYNSSIAGWLALSSLFGIMLLLGVTALYCGYRWPRRAR